MSNPLPDGVDRWHHHHNKPQDDLILITTNRTGYRVSGSFLSKHRSFGFKDLVSEPIAIDDDVKPDLSPKMLQVDLDDSALDLFLDLIAVTALSQSKLLARSAYKQLRQLYQFSDKYRCGPLIGTLYNRLLQSAKHPGEPTDLFLFASKRNDWVLGRRALRKMGVDEVDLLFFAKITEQPETPGTSATPAKSKNLPSVSEAEDLDFSTFLGELPSEWQLMLMKLLIKKGHREGKLVRDWSSVASKFGPPATDIKTPTSEGQAGGSKRSRED